VAVCNPVLVLPRGLVARGTPPLASPHLGSTWGPGLPVPPSPPMPSSATPWEPMGGEALEGPDDMADPPVPPLVPPAPLCSHPNFGAPNFGSEPSSRPLGLPHQRLGALGAGSSSPLHPGWHSCTEEARPRFSVGCFADWHVDPGGGRLRWCGSPCA
jgi:hypothetical protein